MLILALRNKLDYLGFDSVWAHNEFHTLFVNFLINETII